MHLTNLSNTLHLYLLHKPLVAAAAAALAASAAAAAPNACAAKNLQTYKPQTTNHKP